MNSETIKNALSTSISSITSNLDSYVNTPGKDMSRTKKISPETLISFLITQGASSSKCEVLDYFNLSTETPSVSALNQRRSQLKSEAMEAVFHEFCQQTDELQQSQDSMKYRYLAVDGSAVTFFSFPKFATDDYYISEGHSMRGFYSMHINAIYDLTRNTYTDALLQSAHHKDEFRAFCQMVDRHPVMKNTKNVFIADRGYCSYNNMAHVIESGQFFLIRTKDIGKKGLIGNFDIPEDPEFDLNIKVTLARSHKKSIRATEGFYRRTIDKNASFDFIEAGTDLTYDMEFRIVRFQYADDAYEAIVTNLPRDSFPPAKIKELYNSRWGIESSFRKLKYTIGLSYYHSYKPEYIKQEIWAKLIAYNATELITKKAVPPREKLKYAYQVNFTVAAHVCRLYLRLTAKIEPMDLISLIQREFVPIRNERSFKRLKTAHFRKPKFMIYRAA